MYYLDGQLLPGHILCHCDIIFCSQMPPRDTWNGDIDGYYMQYVDLHNETSDWKNISINSYATLLQEINGLVFQHRYMFQMQSYNHLGTSDWTLPYFVFMEVGMILKIRALRNFQLLANLVLPGNGAYINVYFTSYSFRKPTDLV